jgi:hypothetical protein
MSNTLHITERQIVKDIEQYLLQYDNGDNGERSGAASRLILITTIYGANNHFEGIGILQDAILDYREISLNQIKQEEENEK